MDLAKDCDSVVCCRVNPKQKAEVVRLIKNNLNKITLAVGDGANDVNMIQEAHIGIGIYGKEGMRAVQSSDFAIGEFQCLWRLLLIHGRWCYKRNAYMIIYFFYKNMIFTIPHFFFSFVCGSSAQTIFDDWYISFYNLFFTALPLIVRAVFEQDIDYKLIKYDFGEPTPLKKFDASKKSYKSPNHKKFRPPFIEIEDPYLKNHIPKLYYVGQAKTIFTPQRFLGWVLWAIFQSLILFGLNFLVFQSAIIDSDGLNGDLWSFSISYFTTIILLVDLKLALNTTYWIFLNWIALIPLSFCIYFGYFFVSNYLSSTWAYLTPLILVRTMHFYGSVLLGLFTFFLIDYLIFSIPNLISMNLSHNLINYANKKRSTFQKITADSAVNQENSMLQSGKSEDIDEKISGQIEISLQNHFSVDMPATKIN